MPWDFENDFQKVIRTSSKIPKLSKALFIHLIRLRKLLRLLLRVLFISSMLETHQILWISKNVSKNALTLATCRTHTHSLTRTIHEKDTIIIYVNKQIDICIDHVYYGLSSALRPIASYLIFYTQQIQRIRNRKL